MKYLLQHIHRRWLRIFLLSLVVVTAPLFFLQLLSSKVTLKNAQTIHEGMTLSEIKDVMGGEAGDYTSFWYSKKVREEMHYWPKGYSLPDGLPGYKKYTWRSEEVILEVFVDELDKEKVGTWITWTRYPKVSFWDEFWMIVSNGAESADQKP